MAFSKEQIDKLTWREELSKLSEYLTPDEEDEFEEDEFLDAFPKWGEQKLVSSTNLPFMKSFEDVYLEMRFTDTELSNKANVDKSLIGRLRGKEGKRSYITNMKDATLLALSLCQRFIEFGNLDDKKLELLGTDDCLSFEDISDSNNSVDDLKRLAAQKRRDKNRTEEKPNGKAHWYSPLDQRDLEMITSIVPRKKQGGLYICQNEPLHDKLKEIMAITIRYSRPMKTETIEEKNLKKSVCFALRMGYVGQETGEFIRDIIDAIKEEEENKKRPAFIRKACELLENIIDRIINEKAKTTQPELEKQSRLSNPMAGDILKNARNLAEKIEEKGSLWPQYIISFETDFINKCLDVLELYQIPWSKEELVEGKY
jgi:hypothetical protein